MRVWTKRLEQLFLSIGAGILILMMLHTVADVLMRTIWNKPITGTLEITVNWWMVAITALGLWAAELKHDHIVVTLVTDRLSYSARFVHILMTQLITISFLLALAWFGFKVALAKMSTGEFTGSAEIPIWQSRFLIPTAALAFALLGIMRFIRQIRTRNLERDPSLETEILKEQA